MIRLATDGLAQLLDGAASARARPRLRRLAPRVPLRDRDDHLEALGAFLVPGWLTIVLVTSFIGGIRLIVIGVVGEYVGRIYDEVKARPLYLVRELHGFEHEPIPQASRSRRRSSRAVRRGRRRLSRCRAAGARPSPLSWGAHARPRRDRHYVWHAGPAHLPELRRGELPRQSRRAATRAVAWDGRLPRSAAGLVPAVRRGVVPVWELRQRCPARPCGRRSDRDSRRLRVRPGHRWARWRASSPHL